MTSRQSDLRFSRLPSDLTIQGALPLHGAMMTFSFSSTRFLAFAVFVQSILGSTAFAQQFEFNRRQYTARTGDILPIEIRLSGVTEPLVAASFALRVEESSAPLIGFNEAEGVSASLSSFTDLYQTHKTFVPQNSGLIEGKVVEYRAVVKATQSTNPFELGEDTTVAVIKLPIAFSGAGKVVIELVSALDENGVPLISAVLANGQYWSDAEGRAPRGDVATIIVNEKQIPSKEDLTLSSAQNRWVIENTSGKDDSRFLPSHGAQLRVHSTNAGALIRPRSELFGPWKRFEPETLVRVQWDANDPEKAFTTSYRFGAKQESGVVSYSLFVPSEETKHVVSWVQNSDEANVNPFFGVLASKSGEKSTTLVSAVDSKTVSIPALSGRQLEYNQRFSSGVQAAWEPINENPKTLSLSAGEKGLQVALEQLPTDATSLLAKWRVTPSRSNIKLNSRRLYQLEAVVYLNAEARSARGALPQLVFSSDDYAFTHVVQLDSARAQGEKVTISSWFELPATENGKIARMEFVYVRPASNASSDQMPRQGELVALESVKLTSYKMP